VTLIAFHAHRDGATVMTDTLGYTPGARYVMETRKAVALPEVGAVTMTQGSTIVGDAWLDRVQALAAEAGTFDRLLEAAPATLAGLWANLGEDLAWRRTRPLAPTVAFLVGPSERRGGYVGFLLASDVGFEPRRHKGLYVMPSPLSMRPSWLEQARLDAHLARHLDADLAPKAAQMLRRLPAPPSPGWWTADDWRDLAVAVHRDRALVDLYSGLKTYVGGDVVLTTLTADGVTERVLHTFPTDGPEWEAMLRDSLHPVGQLGPCGCDSARLAIECCLPEMFDEPCPCGSGETFAACCKIAHYVVVERAS
jgi:hypothetical protein